APPPPRGRAGSALPEVGPAETAGTDTATTAARRPSTVAARATPGGVRDPAPADTSLGSGPTACRPAVRMCPARVLPPGPPGHATRTRRRGLRRPVPQTPTLPRRAGSARWPRGTRRRPRQAHHRDLRGTSGG